MLHYWLLLSWFGSVSLQYINAGPSPAEVVMDPLVFNSNSRLPFLNYFSLPSQGDFNEQNDPIDNTDTYSQFDQRGEYTPAARKRRTIDAESKNWLPNILEGDKQIDTEDKASAPLVNQDASDTENDTDTEISLRKRSFSPWGGKRSEGAKIEQMWSWKRAARNREPSMPKRVRFSPWGGKRSGQVIYKPGANRVSRVIYSTSIPALTRIVSNYSPSIQPLGVTSYQFRPSVDKRHPIKILAVNAQSDHIREALPFNNLLTSLPALFKPGHPYLDLKKDGKRKVVFSQWGGKRSPPIIGPIWTPSPNNIKEATLDAILLIRNSDINDDEVMKAL